METKKSIRQHLSQMLRKLKPATPRKRVMVATGFFIEETEEACKTELDRIKKHIKTAFDNQVAHLIKDFNMSKEEAEKIALEHAQFRIDSLNSSYNL